MSDLRSRRHEQTRHDIVEAALALFAEHGFSDVTMEQIAERAQVSRSTLYRRFSTRDEIILDVVREWLRVWDECAGDTAHLSARDAMEACCVAVARHIDEHADRVRIAYGALEVSPTLAMSNVRAESWVERFLAIIGRAIAHEGVAPSPALVIAGAYLGAIDATMAGWLDAGADAGHSVEAAIMAMVTQLRPIWPAEEPSA